MMPNSDTIWNFDYLLPLTRFDVGSIFYKYSRVKNEHFCKFWPWPTFQGHPLQKVDGQTRCDHFGERLMKIRVVDIRFVFCFPDETFSSWKMETAMRPSSCMPHTVRWHRVPWSLSANNSRIGWTVFEKTDYMCVFHATWKSWKWKQNFCGKTR